MGAVGISGASADEDEYCALKAVWGCNADDIATTCTTEPLDHSVRTKGTYTITESLDLSLYSPLTLKSIVMQCTTVTAEEG